MDKVKNFLEKSKLVIWVVTSMCCFVSILWATVADPLIDKKIDKKMAPLVSAAIFQNYLIMQTLTHEQVMKALQEYKTLEGTDFYKVYKWER